MKSGIELIADERQRQIEVEGYAPEHDINHKNGELAMAAIHYAAPREIFRCFREGKQLRFTPVWPAAMSNTHDKKEKHGKLKSLVIAGALIAAEIDRLNRVIENS